MSEGQAMQGVKIVRPGMSYYFDSKMPKCPMCGSKIEGEPTEE